MKKWDLLLASTIALGFMSTPAFAGSADEHEQVVDKAEETRLRGKLKALAARNQWVGVERTYQQLESIGAELVYDDLLLGARSAWSVGAIGLTRARLYRAGPLTPPDDQEVQNWLWEIDANYGRVRLLGDRGKATLKRENNPIDPVQKRAIDLATELIKKSGAFEGYLPNGLYFFSGFDINVRSLVQEITVDARSAEGVRRSERQARKRRR